MRLPLDRIGYFINAVGDFDGDLIAHGYSIDSRRISRSDLFFAVRGERLDGHDYVEDALANGAAAAVVRHDQADRFSRHSNLLQVDEPQVALQTLGASVRGIWGNPLIAVTGSTGKTTTKEIISRILATKYRVLKSEGNLNNHFGLPLQLLRLELEHEIAVMELGMSHPGEITALAHLAQPNLGVVTNVAPVHLGFFKSVADIARAKQELVAALPPDGTAVLNVDDEYVCKFGASYTGRIVTFGLRKPADVRAEGVEQRGALGSTFEIVAGSERQRVELPLIGKHNVYNAVAAVAVGLQFGVSLSESAVVLASMNPVDKRGEVLELAGATVINDCYNSNPRALDCMIDALAGVAPGLGPVSRAANQQVAGRRILVAGEMLELGPATDELHRRCGQHAWERKIDIIIGVRGAAKHIVDGAWAAGRQPGCSPVRAEFLETPELAGEWLAREVRPGDVVLLKASRGVRLERALEIWKSRLEAAAAQEA
ncbi:MAG: UDP-N-acetylmuramoyl-tripeptide--D-alanyl-D-alanine ligase [Terriglobales bacterium]